MTYDACISTYHVVCDAVPRCGGAEVEQRGAEQQPRVLPAGGQRLSGQVRLRDPAAQAPREIHPAAEDHHAYVPFLARPVCARICLKVCLNMCFRAILD